MHRQDILEKLQRYDTSQAPEDADCLERFLAFVRAHEDCFERSLLVGHITGSAWIVNQEMNATLLTHHRKLGIWVQLGGHADGDTNALAAAQKEGLEESGFSSLETLSNEIFDLDIHEIPARGEVPAHLHYDVRFAFKAPAEDYRVSDESNDLAWVPLDRLEEFTKEPSMLRMRDKWAHYS